MSVSTETAAGAKLDPLTTPEHPLLLFFDGHCSFCARWVSRVMAADTSHRTRCATLQGTTYQQVLARHPWLAKVDSVVLVTRRADGGEPVFIRSTAIRKLIDGVPGFRIFAFVLHIVPTPISDIGYWIFSKLREPLFGRWADCRPDLRKSELFLD
jgi:predicted DCC family thiol-disulfide oxidoreductase YuxK